MSTTAEQILEQRRQALDRANESRMARAELKRRIARSQLRASEVILDPPPEAETWAVYDVLIAQPRWGRERTAHLLRTLGVSESRTLRRLTVRERTVIARMLGERA